MRRIFILLLLLASGSLWAQTYSLSPVPSIQFFQANGTPCGGCLLYTYAAGTTTPQATFQDSLGATQNPNPVTLNAAGQPPNGSGGTVGLWLTNNLGYKLCLNDPNNVPLYCVDNIDNKVIGTFQDVVNLWQDVTSGCYLRGDGFCIVPPGGGNLSVNGTLTPGRIPYATGATTLANGPLVSSVLTNSPLGTGLNYIELNLSPWVGLLDMGPGSIGVLGWELQDCTSAATGGLLYKATTSGGTCATPATTSDTETHVYIAAGDNAGFAQLSVAGTGYCTFDNSEVPGDYVVTSTANASKCHDAGSSIPFSTFVIGTAIGTAGQVAIQGSISSEGEGNVTTSGMTPGLIQMATNATNIQNSVLQQVSGSPTGPDYVEIYDPIVTYGSGLIFLGITNVQGLMTGNILVNSGTANHLVKFASGGGSGGTGHWVVATTSDTDVLVVPLVSTLNSIGGLLLEPQFVGVAQIVDDGTPCTPGDIVVASSTTAATIHDTGSPQPTVGEFPIGVCEIGSSPDVILLTLGGAASPSAIVGTTYGTATNCASAASTAVCGSAAAGRVVVAASASTVVVDTSAVTANSEIFVQEDTTLGTALSVTCNTSNVTPTPYVSARTAGTSFTITVSGSVTTNPLCLTYFIVN